MKTSKAKNKATAQDNAHMRASRPLCLSATALLVAFVCVLFLSGCAAPCFNTYDEALSARGKSLHATLSTPVIQEAQTLKIGYMEKAGIPQYAGDENNYPTGLDIDVAAAVSAELGLNAEMTPVTSISQAKAQGLDIVMGGTTKNADGYTVVSSYMENGVGLFSKDTQAITKIQDLRGKSIGYVKGSTTEAIVTGSNLQVQQTTFVSLNDAFKALQDDKIDYVAAPAFSGANVAMDYGDIHFVCELSAPEKIGICVAASNAQLIQAVEEALTSISQNGVLNAIDYAWTGTVIKLGGSALSGFTTTATNTDVSADASASASSGSGTDKTSNNAAKGPGDGSTAGANALQHL